MDTGNLGWYQTCNFNNGFSVSCTVAITCSSEYNRKISMSIFILYNFMVLKKNSFEYRILGTSLCFCFFHSNSYWVVGWCDIVDLLNKGWFLKVLGNTEQHDLRFHHSIQNGTQLKSYKLYISGFLHLIFLDHSWLQVIQSETADGWGLL